MSDPVFDRYKEALKQGHLALLHGRPRDALGRYTEAAALADHRALPHLSVGSVLLQLGRAEEALSAYERAATQAPEDPAGHAGRASALIALGRPAGAAEATAQATAIRLLVLDEDVVARGALRAACAAQGELDPRLAFIADAAAGTVRGPGASGATAGG